MDALWQDVRYALRTLARSPGFTAIGVLVLALAIGVNTAIFSLVNALIFVKLPAPHAEELRFIYGSDPTLPDGRGVPAQHREYQWLRASDAAFASMLAYASDSTTMKQGAELRQIPGESVTSNYFDVLQVNPQLGRAFRPEDNAVGAEPAVIISDTLWRNQFASDPQVLGKTLALAPQSGGYTGVTRAYTIVGVAPAEFHGIANRFIATEFWTPLVLRTIDAAQFRELDMPPGARRPVDPVGSAYVNIVMRKPADRSDAELRSIIAQAAFRFRAERIAAGARPSDYAQWTLQLTATKRNRLPFDSTGRIVPTRMAAALMVASGAVLFIALANLAGLLSARAVARHGEMAVRTTLGASASRLTRQVMAESALIAMGGGLLGLISARTMVRLLVASAPHLASSGWAAPFRIDLPIDWRVLAYTALSCVAAALCISLAPIRHATRRDLLAGISEGQSAYTGRSQSRLRRLIVVPQVCGSLMLLVVASMLIRGVLKEEVADRGYESGGVVIVEFELQRPAYYRLTNEQRDEWMAWRILATRKILDRSLEVPGVDAAALAMGANGLPLSLFGGSIVDRETFSSSPKYVGTRRMSVSPEYFEALGIPLRDGRLIDSADRKDTPAVAVICESLAYNLWADASPIGRHIAFHRAGDTRAPVWLEVVGVVGSIALPLTEGAKMSMVYTPAAQDPLNGANMIVAKVMGDPSGTLQALKDAIDGVDPKVFVRRGRSLDETLATLLFPRRLSAAILGTTGLAGLLLACIGLYGVVSYSVAQRVREIGIRTALGADRRDIMRMILRDGARIIATGGILGGAFAFAAIKLTSAKVVALPSADIVTLATAPAILAAAMLLATYIPARRAAAVDPMIALRRL